MNLPTIPMVPGWYADPEARFYDGHAWVYATRSGLPRWPNTRADTI